MALKEIILFKISVTRPIFTKEFGGYAPDETGMNKIIVKI